MDIDKDKIYRIVVASSGHSPILNMVYAEVGEKNEIFGAYSGVCGGLGMFHQNNEIEITVSDDPYEFDSEFGDDVEEISSKTLITFPVLIIKGCPISASALLKSIRLSLQNCHCLYE